MFAVGFWLGAKVLLKGRGMSFFLCSMIAMPFDGYFLAQSLGLTGA
jgi:hypothetical protein